MSNMIKIDGNRVLAISNNIENINRNMDDDFDGLCRSVSSIMARWDSDNADNAARCFGRIKTNHNDNRNITINNYKLFLQQVVNNGYDISEKQLESAANAFK